jgi:hypothetical protein
MSSEAVLDQTHITAGVGCAIAGDRIAKEGDGFAGFDQNLSPGGTCAQEQNAGSYESGGDHEGDNTHKEIGIELIT